MMLIIYHDIYIYIHWWDVLMMYTYIDYTLVMYWWNIYIYVYVDDIYRWNSLINLYWWCMLMIYLYVLQVYTHFFMIKLPQSPVSLRPRLSCHRLWEVYAGSPRSWASQNGTEIFWQWINQSHTYGDVYNEDPPKKPTACSLHLENL